MERHLLLIGFSCTGKTTLGKKAFEGRSIIDSDDELLEWIKTMKGADFGHIYEPEQIYKRFMRRRSEIFSRCPEAKSHDNWDTDVIVDNDKNQFSPEEAVRNIGKRLAEREEYYKENDKELDTTDETVAVQKLRELYRSLEH